MPKEFEGSEIIENREDVIVILKQDVEFSTPPLPKTEKAKINERDRMVDFIRKKELRDGYEQSGTTLSSY